MNSVNPGSRQQIARVLKERHGWESPELTKKKNHKITELILGALPYPEAKQIAQYLTLQKRLGQLAEGPNAWLNKVTSQGRIHPELLTNGAVTGRCTHRYISNVPRVGTFLGEEMRALFWCGEEIAKPEAEHPKPEEWLAVGDPEDWVVVGCDAAGLENRCLGHFMAPWDKGEYARVACEGDVHAITQKLTGLPTRPKAKEFRYALIYGAQAPRLSVTSLAAIERCVVKVTQLKMLAPLLLIASDSGHAQDARPSGRPEAGEAVAGTLAKWLGEHHGRYLQTQLDHGGLLLWVRTRNAEAEKRDLQILRTHSAGDVHVHTLVSEAA